nr:immunoglobulin light chain junction region [Macaca mulatta]
CWQDTQLPPTF